MSSIVYQGLNQTSTLFINNMFTRVIANTGLQTRTAIKGDILVPNHKVKVSKGNIRIRGPVHYNKIPLEVREAKIEQ